MFRALWLACLLITHCTLSIPSSHIHRARQNQVSRNQPPLITPPSVNDINGNGRGSRFFNVSNFPPPTIIVRQNTNHPREFRTIQAAVNSLKDRTGPQVIYVHEGLYREQVYVDYDPPLIIRAKKPNENGQNYVSIVFALGAKEAKSNEASATLNVLKDDFGLYFINVINEYGTGTDTQALALNAKGDRQGYYNCTFRSFQDTVRAYRGIQLYSACVIIGAVDFIFGRDVNAWFEQLTIPILKGSKEPITASGRHVDDISGFFVLNRANVFSAGALPGTAYLGRPWRAGAKAFNFKSTVTSVRVLKEKDYMTPPYALPIFLKTSLDPITLTGLIIITVPLSQLSPKIGWIIRKIRLILCPRPVPWLSRNLRLIHSLRPAP
ncbi:hypothetical protein PtA15_3A733 [Puccinia triticina]|uniref:Pectinesterase n=1 Tax=Puccinia triticina TaxID=208348 RepID=A0ABY7CDS3_9BASI|nr:uncharacterized protein PtA15_3A733 [Puccinia triticina]WAQ83363.1 hypothetical protein PtA15_3A733 [Puccinia triticina]